MRWLLWPALLMLCGLSRRLAEGSYHQPAAGAVAAWYTSSTNKRRENEEELSIDPEQSSIAPAASCGNDLVFLARLEIMYITGLQTAPLERLNQSALLSLSWVTCNYVLVLPQQPFHVCSKERRTVFHSTMLEGSRPVTQIVRYMKQQSSTSTPWIKRSDECLTYCNCMEVVLNASACFNISTDAIILFCSGQHV